MTLAATLALAALAAGPAPLSQWADVSTPATSGAGYEGHRGAAWADIDGDGDLDLYVANWGPNGDPLVGSPNQLLVNQGGGVFADMTAPPLDIPGGVQWGLSHHPAWADIDNDGLLDLYVSQSSNFGQDISRMFRQTAPGVFAEITGGEPLALADTLPRATTWADYDLDGLLDLFVTNSGGDDLRNRLLRNMGDGTFTRIDEVLAEAGRESRGAAWSDFNNDGLPDVYIGNGAESTALPEARRNALYLNLGQSQFIDIADHAGVAHEGHARGVFWGDVDNDGWMDLLVGNNKGSDFPGQNVIWFNNGDLTFTDVSIATGIRENIRSRDVSMADFDNNGHLDLYVVNFGQTCPPNRLWRNDGTYPYINVAPGTPLEAPDTGNAGVWGDYDADGWVDLFVVGGDTVAPGAGANRLCRNENQNGNHWLEIDLTGVISNRLAVGARVTALTGNVLRMREVQSGTGYNAQHMHRLHFGLGTATTVDVLSVRWPSGRVQTLSNVAADRIISIVEDPAAPFPDCNGNGVPDPLDLAAGTSTDCDHDGVLDECDFDPCDDCNANGVWDVLEQAAGWDVDCDGNGELDQCDIAASPGLDADGDGDIDFCESSGDANGDGVVNVDDLVLVITSWGPCPAPCPIDLNGDGLVDVNDLVLVIINWTG